MSPSTNNGSASKKLIKDQLTLAEVKLPNGDVKREVRAFSCCVGWKSRKVASVHFLVGLVVFLGFGRAV